MVNCPQCGELRDSKDNYCAICGLSLVESKLYATVELEEGSYKLACEECGCTKHVWATNEQISQLREKLQEREERKLKQQIERITDEKVMQLPMVVEIAREMNRAVPSSWHIDWHDHAEAVLAMLRKRIGGAK
jgi:hypothetical protein